MQRKESRARSVRMYSAARAGRVISVMKNGFVTSVSSFPLNAVHTRSSARACGPTKETKASGDSEDVCNLNVPAQIISRVNGDEWLCLACIYKKPNKEGREGRC